MKFYVDQKEVYDLTDVKKKVICNDICSDCVDADLERRIAYIISHKYEQCMKRLRENWTQVFIDEEIMVPKDDDVFAQKVFDRPDYKDKKSRDAL